MMVAGRLAEVDADMVKKIRKKEALVSKALGLQQDRKINPISAYDAMMAADKITVQIIRLNRTIRNTVRFL